MLNIPAKYRRCGVKLKCLKCKYQVSSLCGLTGGSISRCEFKDQHRYNLIVCVPNVPGARRTKVLQTQNFDEALIQFVNFKKEQTINGFHKSKLKKVTTETTLNYFITKYLDAVSGVNTPSILIRLRSREHQDDSVRAFQRFRASLTNAGYNFNSLEPKHVGNEEISLFHDFLLDDLNLGNRSYNKHLGILKTLFNWIIRVNDVKISNPFNHVELHNQVKKEITIITKNEFEKFISAINRENSYDLKTKKYMFRDWLISAYKLALQTGLRREELLTLRFSDIVPIDENKLVVRIGNMKVNKILRKNNRMKYIPVTKDLLNLLVELGYDQKKNSDEFIVQRPVDQSMNQATDLLSRCFSHFIKLATNRPFEFGVLRKTYLTRLAMACGPNAKIFTGSSSEAVLKNHYLSQAFMAANLDDFSVL